jgi:hypothetical protein
MGKVQMVDGSHIKKNFAKTKELEVHKVSDNSNVTPPLDGMNQINEEDE